MDTQLKTKPDLELVKYIKEDAREASDSIKILSNRHGGIFTTVINKYTPILMQTGIYKDDLLKDRDYLVWEAASTFDETKNTKFPTWLYDKTRFFCLNTINGEQRKQKRFDKIVDHFTAMQAGDDTQSKIISFIENYINGLQDQRAKSILQKRFFDTNTSGKKNTMKKIAKEVGITSQYCYNIINLHLKKIKELLKQQQYV